MAHGLQLGVVFVIGAIDVGDEREGVAGEADLGGDGVVEAEDAADGVGVDVRAGGVEDECAAGLAVAFDFSGDLGVEERWDFLFGEGVGECGEPGAGHFPEVGEEDAFEVAGAEDAEGAEGEGWEEDGWVEAAPAFAAEDEIAEEGLRIVGQESLIEIEEGAGHPTSNAMRPGCLSWRGLLKTSCVRSLPR